jgi:hypothetical protein
MVPATAYSGRVLAALRIYCLAVIGLHLAAPLFPEAQVWGLWPATYLPSGWRWLLAALAALTCLPPIAARLTRALAGVVSNSRLMQSTAHLTPHSRRTRFAFIALLALIAFSLFRIVHTRWGDAYILVNGIAYPDPALRLTVTWQAPLDVWLHSQVWRLGNAWFGWMDAWPAYRLLSPLAGAVYVYALLRLADSIGRNRTQKLLIVGLMGTLGAMQLFFGYAENYSLAAAGLLLFLWLSLEQVQTPVAGRRTLWQPALALAVTNGLHPSTIVLDPALLYVAWVWGKWAEGKGGKNRKVWWSAAWQVALPMLAVAVGVILLMELNGHGLDVLTSTDRPGGGDARWFVPLSAVSTRWERYTMFSWAHLVDWLNMQMLTAPVTLGGLAIVGAALLGQQSGISSGETTANHAHKSAVDRDALAGLPPRNRISAEIVFLALCTALYWLFTWVWNPDYGGQRDWDLFSLAAIPSTLLLARLLPRALPDRSQLAQAGLALITVSAMHTTAWIYQNTLPWEWT